MSEHFIYYSSRKNTRPLINTIKGSTAVNYKLGKMKDRKNTWVIPQERARLELKIEQRKYHTHEETADFVSRQWKFSRIGSVWWYKTRVKKIKS